MAPPKGPRMPACEPCRQSKLSCDHARPACGRCRTSNKADICVYRQRPFSRKRQRVSTTPRLSDRSPGSGSGSTTHETVVLSPNSAPARTNQHRYPNPGYMGASSHVAIFSHLSQDESVHQDPSSTPRGEEPTTSPPVAEPLLGVESEMQAAKVAECVRHLVQSFSPDSLQDLVAFWRATGANLALAEPLVDICCSHTLDDLRSLSTQRAGADPYLPYARTLLRNSGCPLAVQMAVPHLNGFCSQFLGSNMRLETLGLVFCAVIRAASEVHVFPALYLEDTRRQELVALAVKLTNVIVEVILSFDMLNDLQLVLQYENFISHSYVFGVQSYHSFRKLGDVITSIVTLGYHEKLGAANHVPVFLVDIRRTALARAYSADKNWAIFLGRPPRLCKKFCHLHTALRQVAVPDGDGDGDGGGGENDYNQLSPSSDQRCILHWRADSEMSIWAETRWTAACASLKEEILEMFSDDRRENFQDRVSDLQQRADQQWQALPESFRMEGSLKHYDDRGSWDRDFLVSTRLNYLHVLFLLRLMCLGSPADPDPTFVSLSKEILSLIIEVIVLRNQLVCSTGTSFEWRLAHYGLPAIGIIMLSMLRRGHVADGLQDAKVVRDLGIVVTSVDLGTIVRSTEPNYALLSRATNTIKKFLERIHTPDDRMGSSSAAAAARGGSGDGTDMSAMPQQQPASAEVEDFYAQRSQLEPWDFEIDFWNNLAEHPSMFNPISGA